MATYTQLNGVLRANSINKVESIEENTKDFFNWGLLEAGYFTDINIQTSNLGSSGSFAYNLNPVVSTDVLPGRTWQSPKINFVHENNLESTRQPINISGVYVNSAFYQTSTTSGAFAHNINYPQGRVEFNNPISPTSVVQLNYSYKNVGIYDQNQPWFKQLIFDSFGYESPTLSSPSGVYRLLSDNNIQLPCMVVENIGPIGLEGKQLGDSSLWLDNGLLFHVLTETPSERNDIVNLICNQKDRSLNLYDPNIVAANNYYPLTYRGYKNATGKYYPYLTNPSGGVMFDFANILEAIPSSVSTTLPLFRSVVRLIIRT